jgi:uncharacterized protein (DUF433 family)
MKSMKICRAYHQDDQKLVHQIFHNKSVVLPNALSINFDFNLSLLMKLKTMTSYTKIINSDPNKRFGKPCIRQTRITVYDVLGWLASGMSFDDVLNDFPELTMEDIRACLAFAADRERKLQTAL